MLSVVVDPFQRGFVVNDYSRDLAVFHHGLAADKHRIAVVDPCPDHAVAPCQQTEVRSNFCISDQKGFPIFLCKNRFAAGDLTQQRKAFQLNRAKIGIVLP